MVDGALEVLGDRVVGGVAIVPAALRGDVSSRVDAFGGGHPLPNAEGARGARRGLELASSLGVDDRLLVLVSGGGSALATLPAAGLDLEALRATTDLLLRSGATIDELNAVRKHLDRWKGGRLARAAAPARVLALVVSDVVGDPLDVIASGPTVGDPTTFEDALDVLARRGVAERVPAMVRAHLDAGARGERAESPTPDDAIFEQVATHLVATCCDAAQAALAEAARRGYATELLTTTLEGEAREVGGRLARDLLRAPAPAGGLCRAAAGETTVHVRGDGRGGRNQELALGAARALDAVGGPPESVAEHAALVVSLGTDGIDGPTDAAGAFSDRATLARARALGLDAEAALARNDAYPFFKALDDLLIIGPTGTNVMDLVLAFAAADDESGRS